jgi:hypothetical protein
MRCREIVALDEFHDREAIGIASHRGGLEGPQVLDVFGEDGWRLNVTKHDATRRE